MTFSVNNEKVDNKLILDEMERLRPEYQKVFADQSREEQESQLNEWAKENVIETILLKQEAMKDSRPISADSIHGTLNKLINEHGGEENFYKNLGISKKDLHGIHKDIELQLRIERLLADITQNIPQSSFEEARQYYQQHIDQFTYPEQVRAAHIVKHVNQNQNFEQARVEIDKVKQALDSGKSFEDIAILHSDCPENAGDLGYFTRGQMVQEFEDVVFTMEKNQISHVFQTQFGFHIAKVYDKRPAAPAEFEKVRNQIFNLLAEEKKSKQIENYLDQLREKAIIVEFSDSQKNVFNIQSKSAIKNEQAAAAQRPQKQLSSILVKPAGPDCNMACRYCFYLEKSELFNESKIHRMSDEILEEMVKQMMQQGGSNLSFGWQGGEPTLMGIPFFEKAVCYQEKYGNGQTVGNGLQTNGILINNDWADFLKKSNFLVGLSLDGPEHIHNHYRVLKNGNGSWNKVHDSAKLLLDKGVAVNALIVVNDYSVQFPEEIYDFHKNLGLTYMQFISCVEPNPDNPATPANYSVSPEKYGEMLQKLFDLWFSDFKNGIPTTSIREFDSIFYRYVNMTPPQCTLLSECGIYVVVEHNGDIYSCDFFVEPEWKLGNLKKDKLIDMLNSERQSNFGKLKSTLNQACHQCKWLPYCFGGCPKDRLVDQRDQKMTYFCESYKMFYEHADSRMRELARQWKINQQRESKQNAVLQAVSTGQINVGRNDPCPCGSGKKYKKCCGKNS